MRFLKTVSLTMAFMCLIGGCEKKAKPASLHEAVRKGDLAEVQRLIARGADVNEEDQSGDIPLYYVAARGGTRMVRIAEVLIANGAEVNAQCKTRYGYVETVLHKAAENGHTDLVELLILKGADVNAQGAVSGDTPLHGAAQRGHLDVAKILLAHGADLNASGEQCVTPLHVAAGSGHNDLVEMFLAGGAPIDAKDTYGRTPLNHAAREGRTDTVKLLVARGADINAMSDRERWYGAWTPLIEAASTGHGETVDFLLSKGARIDTPELGAMLLRLAASNGLSNLAERLIEAGVDVDGDRRMSVMRTPLAFALSEGHTDVARLLIAHGAAPTPKDSRGDTALHAAARNGDFALAELVLARGMGVGSRDSSGNSPLHWAARQGDKAIARCLIAHHADVNLKNWVETTPLHYAVSQGHTEMVLLLLANGADVNSQDRDGDTPLHSAAIRGHKDIAELLLKHGGVSDVRDKSGCTPLDEARRYRHGEIVQLLQDIPTEPKTIPGASDAPAKPAVVQQATSAPTPAANMDPNMESLRVQKVVLSEADQARWDIKSLVAGNSAFAVDLYRQLSVKEGNLFFSPYSISTALAMTYAGARENTAAEMAKTMHFSLDQEKLHPAFAELQARLDKVQEAGNVRLSVANSLWPQRGHRFLQDYLALVKRHYGVLVSGLDYTTESGRAAARKTINQWVAKETQNRITDLIQPSHLTDATRLVLTNAIYFKGKWENEFEPAKTKDAPFYLSAKQTVQVPTMHQRERFRYAEEESLQVLELPYRGGELSMLILLPRRIEGLGQMEQSLSVEALDRWRARLREEDVIVDLPRFEMTFGVELKRVLEAMGMVEAFKWPGANFAGFDGDARWFFIQEVVHKAFVRVDEEGTEAAAATAVVMGMGGSPPPPKEFRADHPFLFLIQDNRTASVLFLGRVVDPR